MPDDKPFVLYRSSAGSGKTYTLVKEYLKLILENPEEKRYKKVLAVTFTNKAAGEMKERILKALKNLKNREDKNLEKQLIDEEKLRNLDIISGKALTLLLHNYSDFSVMTIDSFIHKIIKAFAMEIGLPLNFNVELSSDRMEVYVIDNLLAKVGIEEDITRIITAFVQQRLNQGKSWNIELDLRSFQEEIIKSQNAVWVKELSEIPNLDAAREEALDIVNDFINEWNHLAADALTSIANANLSADDFKGKSRSPAVTLKNKYANLNRGGLKSLDLTKTFRDEEKWHDDKSHPAVTQLMTSGLGDLRNKMISLYDSQYCRALTALMVADCLYPAALVNRIMQLLDDYKKKTNSVPISDFNVKVNEIVRDSNVPFIYVLMGEKYESYLVDEFQDTSRMQWENLSPLIENAVSSTTRRNMLVGDSKQSIYRWRGGDMEIMEQGVENKFRDSITTKYLDFNRRSRPNVIAFNNNFFAEIQALYEASGDEDSLLPAIYKHVRQKFPDDKDYGDDRGYVRLQFLEKPGKDEENEGEKNALVLEQVEEIVRDCRTRGYKDSDIAVLVRSKKNGQEVGQFLLRKGIQVVASDSLLMKNVPLVRFLLNVLTCLSNPADIVAEAAVIFFLEMHRKAEPMEPAAIGNRFLAKNQKEISPQIHSFFRRRSHLNRMPVYEAVEEVIRLFQLDKDLEFKTAGYLQAFLNVVADYTAKNSVDVSSFLEWWEFNNGDLSVEVPEDAPAVKIMTIHKAKGLQFPVVIIPFAGWDWEKRGVKGTLWLDPGPDLLKQNPLNNIRLPIPHVATLEKTLFKDQWEKEKKKIEIDNINTIYVAFTRAIDSLYIISNEPPPPKNNKKKPQEEKINNFTLLKKLAVPVLDSGTEPQAPGTHEMGRPTLKLTKESKKQPALDNGDEEAATINRFISQEWHPRITIRRKSKEFWRFDPEHKPPRKRKWGILVHQVLSEIRSTDDLEGVISRIHSSGDIEENERKPLEKKLREVFKVEAMRQWFDPALAQQAFIESTILTDEGMLRPDRVMVLDDKVVIIDFKTGRPHPSHTDQMNTYKNAVRAMGYEENRIEALLFYLDTREVKQV